eukprot:gene17783-24158_t
MAYTEEQVHKMIEDAREEGRRLGIEEGRRQAAVEAALPRAVQAAVEAALPRAVQAAVEAALPRAVQAAVEAALPTAVQAAVEDALQLSVPGGSGGSTWAPAMFQSPTVGNGRDPPPLTALDNFVYNVSVAGMKLDRYGKSEEEDALRHKK